MATVEEAVRRATADQALAESLAAQDQHAWAATVTYYAAVGLVHSLLIRDGRFTDDLDDHARLEYVRTRHPGLRADYEALLGRSLRGRYHLAPGLDAASSARVAARLERIRAYVDRVHANGVPGK